MNVFLRLGFSVLLLLCARVHTQGQECGAGCHHGFCEQSGECRCRSGWSGAVCDQCVPSVDCVHGRCEEPGQCICEHGWSGARCDRDARPCSLKPCSGNSTCVDAGGGRGHVCLCPAGHTGENCRRTDATCSGSVCQNGGTCVSASDGAVRCACPARFAGPSCELHVSRPKLKARAPAQHYAAFHKLLRAEPRPPAAPLLSSSQVVCFALLGLLTCLVILGTTAIIFFHRCEAWMANARYSQLVRRQRDVLSDQPPVNVILPEKIRLSSYGRRYTSI